MITVRFDWLPLRPGHRILDIGCGSGRHVGEAARQNRVTVVGADLSWEAVLSARNRIQELKQWGVHGGGTETFLVSNITRLPFGPESFDLVICSEVLEHIPDQEQAIRELIRVLKSGGNLVVSVPRYLPERICWALSDAYHQASQGHIRIYKKKELLGLLEGSGSRLWATHFAHGLHTPYWWLRCLVGPTREDHPLVRWYHRVLVWDIMKKPLVTRLLDRLFNPVIGKSIVFYLRKDPHV